MIPRWLADDLWPASQAPYTSYVNGQPTRRRDGEVRTHTSASRFVLPVCRKCNGHLNDRFEVPAKPLLRSLFRNQDTRFNESETRIVGLWFLKTWLLLTHPELRASDPGLTVKSWEPIDQRFYEWMVDDAKLPPKDLSLWFVKLDLSKPPAATKPQIEIPEQWVDEQNRPVLVRSRQFGINWFDVSLAHHPGWPIEHPLEARGEAARLWPPGASWDLERMPAVPVGSFTWVQNPHLRPHSR